MSTKTNSLGISVPFSVAVGGTGSSSLPNKSVLIGEGNGNVSGVLLLNGQVLVGKTGDDPEACYISGGNGISIQITPGYVIISTDSTLEIQGITLDNYLNLPFLLNGVLVSDSLGSVSSKTPLADQVLQSDSLSNISFSSSIPLAVQNNITNVGSLTSGTWNASTISVNRGGTGQTSYTNGQILIGNTATSSLSKSTMTAGAGVTITNGAGTITVAIGQAVSTTSNPLFAGIRITTTGAAARAGVSTLVAGSVTINTTSVTASSLIQLTYRTFGGVFGSKIRIGVITPGVSFTVVSDDPADTSSFNWTFIN